MPTPLITINSFEGGQTDDETAQTSNSFHRGVSIDIHDRVGYLRPSFKATEESTTTFLITAIDNYDGDATDKLYGFDGARVYKRTGTTWSVDRTLAGVSALDENPEMVNWNNFLWYFTKTDIGKLNATTYDDDYLTTVISGAFANDDGNWHPAKQFLDKLFIGDGRNVASLDTSETFVNNALVLPVGYRIRAMEVIGDRLALACGGDTTTSGGGTKSAVFFWDGTSSLYESKIDVDVIGGVQAIKEVDNILYLFARDTAPPAPAGIDIYYYTGSDFDLIKKTNSSPNSFNSVRMYPNAVVNWNDNLLFGSSNAGTGTGQTLGVWKFGRPNVSVARSLVIDNIVSTGVLTTPTISAMKVFGNQYFFANTTGDSVYRVDALSTSTASTAAFMESQIYEMSTDDTGRLVQGIKLFADTMPANTAVVVKYDIDDTGSFTTLGTINSTNQKDILYGINKLAHTFKFRLEFTTTGTSMPEISKISIY